MPDCLSPTSSTVVKSPKSKRHSRHVKVADNWRREVTSQGYILVRSCRNHWWLGPYRLVEPRRIWTQVRHKKTCLFCYASTIDSNAPGQHPQKCGIYIPTGRRHVKLYYRQPSLQGPTAYLFSIMLPQLSLDDLVSKLGEQEDEFLSVVHSEVESYIKNQGKECIAIIEKDAYGPGCPRTHHPGIDSYIKVLACFIRRQPYHDHELDSVLTEPVAQLVGECYDNFLSSKAEIISQYFLQHMLKNELILETIMGYAANTYIYKQGLSSVRSKAIHVMVQGIRHAAETQWGHTVTAQITATVSTASGYIVAHHLGPIIIKLIAVHLHTVVTHVLASAAFKAFIYSAAQHCIRVAAGAMILHLLAAKFGTVLAPIYFEAIITAAALSYIAYTIYKLPKELGEKVAESVVAELRNNFREMNLKNMEKVAEDIFGTDEWMTAIGSEFAATEGVEQAMKDFGDALAKEIGHL
jgi:hypothetical protein